MPAGRGLRRAARRGGRWVAGAQLSPVATGGCSQSAAAGAGATGPQLSVLPLLLLLPGGFRWCRGGVFLVLLLLVIVVVRLVALLLSACATTAAL